MCVLPSQPGRRCSEVCCCLLCVLLQVVLLLVRKTLNCAAFAGEGTVGALCCRPIWPLLRVCAAQAVSAH
jgi:hypothetical protein